MLENTYTTSRLYQLLGPVLDPQCRVPQGVDLTELFDLGMELCRQGHWQRGIDILERLRQPEQSSQRYAGIYFSYLGLGLATQRGHIAEGLRLCRFGARRQGDHPETHLNLARALLHAGYHALAYEAARKGLAVDPEHPELTAFIARVGRRRPLAFPFLDRGHAFNRWLGALRHRCQSLLGRNPGQKRSGL